MAAHISDEPASVASSEYNIDGRPGYFTVNSISRPLTIHCPKSAA
jgi:hypothetical protein